MDSADLPFVGEVLVKGGGEGQEHSTVDIPGPRDDGDRRAAYRVGRLSAPVLEIRGEGGGNAAEVENDALEVQGRVPLLDRVQEEILEQRPRLLPAISSCESEASSWLMLCS